jgi:Peptidase U49
MNPGIDPTTHYLNHLRCLVPEKSHQIDRFVEIIGGLTFLEDDRSERFLFQASADQRVITIGLKGLQRLWAYCLAYFCIYTEIGEIKQANPAAREFDLNSTDRFRKARKLLSWAVGNEIIIIQAKIAGVDPKTFEMPSDLPQPFAASAHGSDESCADELCLVALGWIIFHELVHIERGHKNLEAEIEEILRNKDFENARKISDKLKAAAQEVSAQSILEEKEADMGAAEWVLSGVLDDQPKLLKRGMGVMVGLVWLASREVYKHREEFGTHPPAYDRLYQVLLQFFPDGGDANHDLIWNSSQLMLNLHLQDYGIPLDETREFDSFQAATDEAIERIIHPKRN